jgi:hypothetical protein
MIKVKALETETKNYKYTGPVGSHHAIVDGESVLLEPGDVIPMSTDQYNAFKDRFVSTDEKATPNPDAFKLDPSVTPVPQTGTGNMIREVDVVEDRTAGHNAFKSAGLITADSAAQAEVVEVSAVKKVEEPAKAAETKKAAS